MTLGCGFRAARVSRQHRFSDLSVVRKALGFDFDTVRPKLNPQQVYMISKENLAQFSVVSDVDE